MATVYLQDVIDSGRATITVPEWGALMGVGRNQAYEAAQRGEIPGLLSIGRRRLVSVPVTLAWLGVQTSDTTSDGPHEPA